MLEIVLLKFLINLLDDTYCAVIGFTLLYF